MRIFLRCLALTFVACALAWPAHAQQGRGRPDGVPGAKSHPQPHRQGGSTGGMSPEQRERLREEVGSARRGVYRESGPDHDARRPPHRPMAPDERDRLRRDIQDANRDFERRR